MNSIVLSKMQRHVLSRMPLSCYQKSKREFIPGKIAKFGSLNSSNQENISSGFILTLPEPVDNGFEWNPTSPSKQNSDRANTTQYYSRVRWISTGIAERRQKPLACECRVESGGRMRYVETFECSDLTVISEVRRGSRWRNPCKVRVSRCSTLRLELREGLYRPRSRQVGVSVRSVRGRRLDVHVACEREFLVRKSCRATQFRPIQSLCTVPREAS